MAKKYRIGQQLLFIPNKEEWDAKYPEHNIWTKRFETWVGKMVQILDHTPHRGGEAYRIRPITRVNDYGEWVYEESLIPPSRKEIQNSLLNGHIDVPTFHIMIKAVDKVGK